MFWQTYPITENTLYCCTIGFVQVWLKKIDNDLYLSHKHYTELQETRELSECTLSSTDENFTWTRWILAKTSSSVLFTPFLPDKPLIIKPEIPIIIPPGNEGVFFINIPLWIRIGIKEEKPLVISEIPVSVLSNSWFGDTLSGELCYAKNSFIQKNFKDLGNDLWNAVCAVSIINNSKSELSFDRFCLHVENLTLFSGEIRFWTNQVKLVFQGEDQLTQVTILKTRPNFEKTGKIFSEPREKIDTNIIKKSFKMLKTITGF